MSDGCIIEDLNSKNGILVNRKRRSRALLRNGDTITLGQLDIAVNLGDNLTDVSDDAEAGQKFAETIVIGHDTHDDRGSGDENTGTQETLSA